jgi:hypothetical protein
LIFSAKTLVSMGEIERGAEAIGLLELAQELDALTHGEKRR